jgi:hypothetical protein
MPHPTKSGPTIPKVTDRAAQRHLTLSERHAAYPPRPDTEATNADDAPPAIAFSLPRAPLTPTVNLAVPYIHQLWDTPDHFDGHWACGPTSTAMLLAAYDLLEARPIKVSYPTRHHSDYGRYASNPFDHHGRTFNDAARTPTGTGSGLYGAIVYDGLAQASRSVNGVEKGILPVLRHFLAPVGNTVEFIPRPSRRDVVTSLDDGHPVILSGNVFGWGHILVIRGYAYDEASNVYHWLVNDPYGYRVAGNHDGEGVAYRWQELHHPAGEPSKYLFRVRGPRRAEQASQQEEDKTDGTR